MAKATRADVVVVGASLGGVAAAVAAARQGASVLLLEGSGWIGGQLTAQGVCTPDDTRAVDTVGATRTYQTLRERIRDHYRTQYRLSDTGRTLDPFNPGSNWVTFISVEPRVAQQLLYDLLPSSVALHLHTPLERAEVHGDRIRAVVAGGRRFEGTFFLDATDLGDLLPLCGAEFSLGAESAAETGEPHAPPEAHPDYIQPFTFPFILEKREPPESHIIVPPYDYEALREEQQYHVRDGAMTGMWNGRLPWWTYRRIVAAENFADPAFPNDLSAINTNSNDYRAALLPGASAADLARARRASLGYLFWLQTECPREDDPTRLGYPELRLVKEMFDTPDGLSPQPYIRESRRIKALATIREQDIVAGTSARAHLFPDAVGIGDYSLDVHYGTVEPNLYLPTRPYQIPLDALIPARLTNLLPACKNIGTTHLTSGAYRVHSIEWAIGEAAGTFAAWCAHQHVNPHDVHQDAALLRRFQRTLLQSGAPIFWWSDIRYGDPAWEAAHLLGVQGFFVDPATLEFRPDDPLTQPEHDALEHQLGRPIAWTRWPIPRAAAALELLPLTAP